MQKQQETIEWLEIEATHSQTNINTQKESLSVRYIYFFWANEDQQ